MALGYKKSNPPRCSGAVVWFCTKYTNVKYAKLIQLSPSLKPKLNPKKWGIKVVGMLPTPPHPTYQLHLELSQIYLDHFRGKLSFGMQPGFNLNNSFMEDKNKISFKI